MQYSIYIHREHHGFLTKAIHVWLMMLNVLISVVKIHIAQYIIIYQILEDISWYRTNTVNFNIPYLRSTCIR